MSPDQPVQRPCDLPATASGSACGPESAACGGCPSTAAPRRDPALQQALSAWRKAMARAEGSEG